MGGTGRRALGLDADQRAQLNLPDGLNQNSWAFGLERLLLGYAVGDGDAWDGRIQPCDEAAGLEVAALGPLAQLVDALRRWSRVLAEPAAPAQWGERLRQLMADFCCRTTTTSGACCCGWTARWKTG